MFVVSVASLLPLLMIAQTLQAREIKFGTNDYVEYMVGDANCPLILAAPHGGYLRPTSIPDRTGNVTTVTDTNTLETTREIDEAFYQLTGCRPHVVISHLNRVKLDPNREVEEAAQHPEAETAYHEFHGFIEEARRSVEHQLGRGLFFDVHGHGHSEMWIEWGYLLTSAQLQNRGDSLNALVDQASIRNLALAVEAETLESLLRGERSIAARMEAYDPDLFKSVPGPSFLDPDGGNYFRGGYNTRVHGSVDGGQVDAIQIELPQSIRFTVEPRNRFAVDFAAAAMQFLNDFYGCNFSRKVSPPLQKMAKL